MGEGDSDTAAGPASISKCPRGAGRFGDLGSTSRGVLATSPS